MHKSRFSMATCDMDKENVQGTLKNLWLHYNASSLKGSRSCSVGYCGDSLWRSSSND